MNLSVEINGKHVPLADCDWVLWMPCGCPRGVCRAAIGTEVIAASEDAAWREFFDTKKEVERAKRQALRMELVTHDRYSRDVCPLMLAGCSHAEPKPAEVPGQMSLAEVVL